MRKIKLTNRFYILTTFFIVLDISIRLDDIGVAVLYFLFYLLTFNTTNINTKKEKKLNKNYPTSL